MLFFVWKVLTQSISAEHFSPHPAGERLERFFDQNMTEWERGREQEEFFRAAMFYRSSNSTLSSRFTRAKYEDDVDKVEVPRDQEVFQSFNPLELQLLS